MGLIVDYKNKVPERFLICKLIYLLSIIVGILFLNLGLSYLLSLSLGLGYVR